MAIPSCDSFVRRIGILGCAAFLAAGLANAQSAVTAVLSSASSFSSSGESSSLQIAETAIPSGLAALPSAPSPSAAGGGAAAQASGGWRHNLLSHYALEFGGGMNAPTDKNYITWGGNFTVGAGAHLTDHVALLAEYQFIDDKLPGKLIAEAGAQGGHAHIWSLTLNPVIDLFPKATNDIYLTGGGGFYRKVTSFTDLVGTSFCYYFYGCSYGYVPQTVGHFSSNQGGWNIGGGFQHRLGGMYGDSRMKVFAEVRYLDVLSPAVMGQSANGLAPTTIGAGTKLIPITLGVRW